MNKNKAPTPPPEDAAAVAGLMAQYFLAFLEGDTDRTGTITEQPEAQSLLDALQEIAPDADRTSLLAKMFLVFCGGVDAGIEISDKLTRLAGEGAQA